MRYLVILVIAVVAMSRFFASSGQTLGYATLTRYGSVPILRLGAPSSWDENQIAGEQVFYDPDLATWVMAYVGIDAGGTIAFGLAYSSDLLTWTKEAANPVFEPNVTEGNIATANIVRVSTGSYRMYYQSYGGSDGGSRLYAATATDIAGPWTRYNSNTPVLLPGAGAAWDSDVVFDQEVHVYGGTTYLYYGGQKVAAGPTVTRGIGLATAADGFTFAKAAGNPLLVPSGGESHINLGAMSVQGDATTFDMWYDSSTTPDHRYINHATTSDGGATWDTVDYDWFGPSSVGWDSGQVFDAAAVVDNGILYLFYAGSVVTGGGVGLDAEIGLATMAWP